MKNLQKLMDLTCQVQALVEAGAWSEAAALECSRRPLVEAFLDSGPDARQMAEAGALFEKVVAIDARMLERIKAQRHEALGELRQEIGTGKAVKAYLSNSGVGVQK